MANIPEQVRLSPAVAFGIVLQGIRVRLGRSIVTLAGVALGIAFLSSILTGRLIEKGVSHEKHIRTDVGRMMSFLTAETGDLKERTVVLVGQGARDEVETRFVQGLNESGTKVTPFTVQADAFRDASAIVFIGENPTDSGDINQQLSSVRQRVVAYTRVETKLPGITQAATSPESSSTAPSTVPATQDASPATAPATTEQSTTLPAATAPAASAAPSTTVVALARQPSPEEIQEAQDAVRRAAARDLWIILISLGVTVIGITNSMLMSVTERFREIGTMRCLGAVSGFIRRLFLIESSLVGVTGAAMGALMGAGFAIVVYGARFGFPLVLVSLNYPGMVIEFVCAVVAGVVLSIIAALYPAGVAAKMVPATALRTNV